MIDYTGLCKEMKEKGIDLKTMCEDLGLTDYKLKRRLNGNGYINIRTLEKIVKYMGIGIDRLIKFVDGDGEYVAVDWNKVDGLKKVSWRALSDELGFNESTLPKMAKRNGKMDRFTFQNLCRKLSCKPEDIAAAQKDPADDGEVLGTRITPPPSMREKA